jgi:hypothetical protein
MKNKTFIITVMLALSGMVAVPAVSAQNESHEKKPSKTTLKRYDKNKDGVLSPEEEAEWKADKEKAKAKRAEKKHAKEKADTETTK